MEEVNRSGQHTTEDSQASMDRTSVLSHSPDNPVPDVQIVGSFNSNSTEEHGKQWWPASSTDDNGDDDDDDEVVTKEEDQEGSQCFCCPKGSRTQILTFICIGISNLAGYCCYSIISPFFPEVALQRGASQTTVGLIFGCYAVVCVFAAPVFGKYITTIGSRFMLVAGVCVAGCCSMMFGFVEYMEGTTFVVFCFLIRTMEALGVSAYFTAGTAILTHAFPNSAAKVMGILEVFSGLGLMAGPPIGGLLYGVGGFKMPFLVVGGMMLCCGGVVWILVPQQDDKQERKKKTASLLSFLRIPTIALTCGLTVVMSCSISFLDPIYQPYLSDQFEMSPTDVGLVFLLWSGVYAVTAPAFGFFADIQIASRFMITGGMVVLTVSVLMIAPSPLLSDYLHILPVKEWVTIVGCVVMSLACGPAFSSIFNEMLWAASDAGIEDNFATYGMVSGLYNAGYSVGEFVGPIASSVLAEKFGFPWATTVFGGFTLFYTIVLVIFYLWDYMYFMHSKRRHTALSTEEDRECLLLEEV
ncbi:MFS-type transporter SLC18B1-like isoform X1 [Branchiostoma lanceolatum]|uniref:MFS-type transporter SLC18B1-like isoform X1 n=2 Tax=Branchiostoma lanceolatum TaxID=7740 RepID=UPI0034563261